MKRQGFWNLPNTLTVLRIFMVPLMVWLLWEYPTPMEALVAMVIFVGAMLTDIVDGYLARKWNLVSPVGAFLDPLADKLMVATTMIMLVYLRWLSPWLVALIICRELTITALRAVAVSEGLVMPADLLGKMKTAFQSTALAFLLLHFPTKLPLLPSIELNTHSVGLVLMYIALFFTLASAYQYLAKFVRYVNERERAAAAEARG